jgi:DNA-binding GntR family transcriptional regulator
VSDRITKAQAIYGALLDDIEEGRLPPGRALDEIKMARTYGVSRTPVREAIRRLELTGLVETRSHRGAVVAGRSEKQLDDMFAVMAELEGLCAKWAALAMTAAERKSLAVLHAGAEVFVRCDDREAYVEANTAFHGAIYDGAHNVFLCELVRATRRRAVPFRNVQFQGAGRLAKSHREHGHILDAILAGAADAAYAAMRAHIVVVRSAVDEVLGVADAVLDEAAG